MLISIPSGLDDLIQVSYSGVHPGSVMISFELATRIVIQMISSRLPGAASRAKGIRWDSGGDCSPIVAEGSAPAASNDIAPHPGLHSSDGCPCINDSIVEILFCGPAYRSPEISLVK